MLSYQEILDTLRGRGKIRRPRRSFWALWYRWERVMRQAGVVVYQDSIDPRHPGPWYVNITLLTRTSLNEALSKVLNDPDALIAPAPPPPVPNVHQLFQHPMRRPGCLVA